MRECIAGVKFDCLLEQSRSLRCADRIVPRQSVALQHTLVGDKTRWRLAARSLGITHLYPTDERADDCLHDPVLDGENLVETSVEFFDPNMVAGLGVDQLDADSDTFADAPDATFNDKTNVQFPSDLLH